MVFKALLFYSGYNIKTCKIIVATFLTLHFLFYARFFAGQRVAWPKWSNGKYASAWIAPNWKTSYLKHPVGAVSFYRAMCMHSADSAIARCPSGHLSVCPSVTRQYLWVPGLPNGETHIMLRSLVLTHYRRVADRLAGTPLIRKSCTGVAHNNNNSNNSEFI